VTLPRAADVLVVGGGVVGCAIAHALAATGRSVVVAERGAVGGEASSAAAGVLGVASAGDEDARLKLRRASLAMFPALVESLEGDVGFERRGVVALAFDDAALGAERERAARRRAHGLRAEPLDRVALATLEPQASPGALGATFHPDDATVDAAALVAALARGAAARGAVVAPGTPLHAIERERDRVTRARVGDGWLAPGVVVVAAGAWSASVAGLDTGVAVTPVRGQMLALRPATPLCRAVLTAGDAFLVPRRDGELWVGATFEHAGFERAVTADGVGRLLAHVGRLVPAAVGAPIVRLWSGLRPALDDGPVIARAPVAENVVVATGHHRSGVLLAPITAAAVTAVVAGTPPPAAARPFVRA
jgi:glycine oxidase